jgi:hypothetical protein
MAEVTATVAPWMLVAGTHSTTTREGRAALSTGPVLAAVARRGLPNLVEATIVPALLFFVVAATIGAVVAMAVVLGWGYGAIVRRVLRGERIPAILLLATLGLTTRTFVGLLSGSTFAYFLQPVATTVVLAGVFLGSALIGRPVIARLAHDFCPIAPEVADRPGVVRLFVGLTILWSGVHLVTAATTLGMLVSMSVPMFVAIKTVACLGITVGAIAITVYWALHTARREHLTFAAA